MKYKNIDSMLHNFGHSFVSLMNYIDDEYIIDILDSTLRALPSPRLEIRFPSQLIQPAGTYSPVLLKSVHHYAEWLPEHMQNHEIAAAAIPEVVLVIVGDRRGMHCDVRAVDDRGRLHDVRVQEAA